MKLLTYLILPCILFSNGALAAQKTGKPVASKPSSITGQVFVVTRTRESIKLALVEVLAIPEQEFLQQIEASKKLKLEVESAEVLAKQESDQADNNVRLAEENMDLAFRDFDNAYIRNGEIDDDWYEERYSDLAVNKHLQLTSQAKKYQLAKSESLRAAKSLVEPFITGQYYFASLPKGFASKTDADGKFVLDLPAGKYVVAAKSSRLVSRYSQEDDYWLIYVDTTSKNQSLMLSNDNLFETQCNECVQP